MISKCNCKISRHAKRRTTNQKLLRKDTRGVSRSLCRVEKNRGYELDEIHTDEFALWYSY